jgi:hypothetical protein
MNSRMNLLNAWQAALHGGHEDYSLYFKLERIET